MVNKIVNILPSFIEIFFTDNAGNTNSNLAGPLKTVHNTKIMILKFCDIYCNCESFLGHPSVQNKMRNLSA